MLKSDIKIPLHFVSLCCWWANMDSSGGLQRSDLKYWSKIFPHLVLYFTVYLLQQQLCGGDCSAVSRDVACELVGGRFKSSSSRVKNLGLVAGEVTGSWALPRCPWARQPPTCASCACGRVCVFQASVCVMKILQEFPHDPQWSSKMWI